MQIQIYALIILLFGLACTEPNEQHADINTDSPPAAEAFNNVKWKKTEGSDYPYRDLMLGSLLASDTLKQMEKEEVLDLLGPPDRTDHAYLFYRIAQTRLGVWPLHTKTLVIKFTENGPVDWVRIHE